VLAVGDASFQRKCLNKMESVSRRGRTVFFVSHNMPAITRLCPRVIMMDQGRLYQDGPASQVVSAYLRSGLGTTASREWPSLAESPGNEVVRLRAVRVKTEAGQAEESVDIRSALAIEMDYDVLSGERVLVPNLHFFNEDGICLFVAADAGADWRRRPKEEGSYRTSARIPGNFFAEGTIIVRAAISTMDPLIVHVNEPDVLAFQVVDSAEGDSARGDYAGPMPGLIRPVLDWSTTVLTRSS
jgi:lipopolysaccharide transport system ATP-binding protein